MHWRLTLKESLAVTDAHGATLTADVHLIANARHQPRLNAQLLGGDSRHTLGIRIVRDIKGDQRSEIRNCPRGVAGDHQVNQRAALAKHHAIGATEFTTVGGVDRQKFIAECLEPAPIVNHRGVMRATGVLLDPQFLLTSIGAVLIDVLRSARRQHGRKADGDQGDECRTREK